MSPAPTWRSLAMRLALFSLPLLVASGALEWRLSRLPSSYAEKRQELEGRLGSLAILSLGSSHGLAAVRPASLPAPGFNAAMPSQSLYYDRAILERYLPRLPALRVVVLPVSALSLRYQLDQRGEGWRAHAYQRFWGLPPRTAEERWALGQWSWGALYGADNVRRFLLDGFRMEASGGVGPDGWRHSERRFDGAPQDVARVVRLHRSQMSPAHLAGNLRTLEAMLARLRERGVVAVVVVPPVTRGYSEGLGEPLWAETCALLAEAATRHGAVFLDHHVDPRFGPGEFSDPDHLNSAGAERFTALLSAEAIVPALRGGRPAEVGR